MKRLIRTSHELLRSVSHRSAIPGQYSISPNYGQCESSLPWQNLAIHTARHRCPCCSSVGGAVFAASTPHCSEGKLDSNLNVKHLLETCWRVCGGRMVSFLPVSLLAHCFAFALTISSLPEHYGPRGSRPNGVKQTQLRAP